MNATESGPVLDETTVVELTDAVSLEEGKKIFISNCASCHKESGAGDIGPNLTDEYWLHGGSIGDLFKVVKNGVPATNMISWAAMLSPKMMQQVSSYILTLKGTNPPNPKEPQGEKYIPMPKETVVDTLTVKASL